MTDPSQILVFDRALVRQHRDRAADNFTAHDALFQETAALLAERLDDVTREFKTVLDLGAHNGMLAQRLEQEGRFVVAADISESMLGHGHTVPLPPLREGLGEGKSGFAATRKPPHLQKLRLAQGRKPDFLLPPQGGRACVVCDEEFLPFAADSFDLIISNASLHWANDLPGALIQIHNALKPDGLFLATIFGGETLHELRACMTDAELAITGGVSPRLSPVADLPAASGLLQRAGFQLPVADREIVTLTYPDAFALMHDLRGMGESNAHLHRLRYPTRRAVLFEAARLYQQRFADANGRIAASFDVLFLHGWKHAA